MQAVVDALRAATRRQIDENPVEVTVARVERRQVDGAFDEVRSTLGPYRVRVYTTGSGRQARVETSTPGSVHSDQTWGLLAPHDADIQAGAHLEDTFDVPGLGRFRVRAVHPQLFGGQVVSLHCDLEKVG